MQNFSKLFLELMSYAVADPGFSVARRRGMYVCEMKELGPIWRVRAGVPPGSTNAMITPKQYEHIFVKQMMWNKNPHQEQFGVN